MSQSRPGFLVAIEGIDGAGKSTLIRPLADMIAGRWGVPVLCTAEPYTLHIIREMQHEGPIALAVAYTLDRYLHVRDVIAPYLMRDYMVLTDRYMHSTLAYQEQATTDRIEALHTVLGIPLPDLVIYLDVDPIVAAARANGSVDHRCLARIAEAYQIAMRDSHPYMVTIDANQDADAVLQTTFEALEKYDKAQEWLNGRTD